ncbi:MAG TPA: hypothetical protein VJN01_06025 [Xanthomonadales bacterium]|nr:hypothetical protein [Xanthomonadales bacterium]
MNLSHYLLLPAQNDLEPNATPAGIGDEIAAVLVASRAANQAIPATTAVYDPGRIASGPLLQASYCQAPIARSNPITSGALGFSAAVLANTCGFLLMTSGLLLLLQIAQLGLG